MDVEADLRPAMEAMRAFWAALAGDDDLALLRLTTRGLQEQAGTGPGMCARLRAAWFIDAGACLRMGAFSTAYVLPVYPVGIAFACKDMENRPDVIAVPPGPIWVRRPIMELEQGFWRCAGAVIGHGWPEGTREMDIPTGEPGPIN